VANKMVLVLDDEADILEMIAIALKKNGFSATTFEYTSDFWKYLDAHTPSIIILDLMLNGSDGIEVCKQLKTNERFAGIPVIMLTALSEVTDKIIGLEIGADDYMTKPFSPRELIARIKAILRRLEKPEPKAEIIVLKDDLIINPTKYEVTIKGKKIDLTPTEFKLLKVMAERKGWVFSRDQLLDYLWGNDKVVIDRTIDVHIKNLRDKLHSYGELIKNIRGVGYKLDL